jgi:TonB-dependent receptor
VAEALKRVPGLTLVDDKFVYVRGLGERYSSVLLNGAKLSSTDPTRRVVELDFIPGEILEGIVVQKSYSPDLPSDFGGGTILLRPRSYPEEFFFNLSASGKYQLDTTLEEGKTYKGGDWDFLGFDDGARDLPGRVPSRQAFGEMTPEQREATGESFPQIYDVDDETFPPDVDLSLAAGNRHRPGSGENTFGYLAALRYSQSWDILDQDWRTFNRGGNVINDWELEWNDQNINTGAFLNLGASLGKNHRLSSTTMVLRDTLKSVHIRQGYFSDWDQDVVNTELGWLERQLLTQQLSGEHDFPALANLDFDWQYTYSLGDRQEPDLRNYTYVKDGDQLRLPITQPNNNFRNYSDMEDTTHDFSFDIGLPLNLLEKTYIKTGFKAVDKSRDFGMRRFAFQPNPFDLDTSILNQPLEQILNNDHINPNEFSIVEITRPSDIYSAEQSILAFYGMADLRINQNFGLTGGMRYESSDQKVRSFDQHGKSANADLDVDDVLPSLAATYFIDGKDKTTVRLAYSQTTNRPDFKELSTAEYTDPVTRLMVVGNPDLVAADLENYEIRIQHFFSPNENLALSLFYKTFDNPIEKIRLTAADRKSSFINSDEAENYGIEVEALKYLDFINGMENFYIGGNFAWIDSEVTIPEEQKGLLTNDRRPLEGQSDYVFNLNLGYENSRSGILAALLFNYTGERISELGTFGRPDIYLEPTTRLDFVYRQELSRNWKLNFELENILDPEVEYTQGSGTTRSFSEGRAIAVGFDYTFR